MVLHKLLRQTDNAFYSPQGFVDSEDSNGEIKLGQWRSGNLSETENNCLQILRAAPGSRYGREAFEMGENLQFISTAKMVAWRGSGIMSIELDLFFLSPKIPI